MGNANGREEGERDDVEGLENGDSSSVIGRGASSAQLSVSVLANNDHNHNHSNDIPPNHAPARSTSPFLFPPQVPVAPLQKPDAPPPPPSSFDQMWQNESPEVVDEDQPPERGIPTIITWNYGGNDVAVEGSFDNFTSRKRLQRSGKDHSILMVLPSGIYHYKFIVDGEWRYIPDLPFVTDEMGCVCNLLDVHGYVQDAFEKLGVLCKPWIGRSHVKYVFYVPQWEHESSSTLPCKIAKAYMTPFLNSFCRFLRDFVPENIDSAVEFKAPPSPDSTYSQAFPAEDDFAKEPLAVPLQQHLTVLDEASSSKPQHVVLNHLYMEKGWASQSLVALGTDS